MAKRKTIAALVNDAATVMQRMVRVKAALASDESRYIECVTCGQWKHWTGMQGGHFISRRFTAHKLLEENIHPQCPGCNGPRQGNLVPYTTYMIDMYGRDFVDDLEYHKGATKKYLRVDIEQIIKDLKAELKDLEEQL